MRKHWIWLLALAVAASWVGNVWFYESQKVDKPIFLKHYYEMPESLLQHMRLYYLTNKDSSREPYQVELADGIMLHVEHIETRDEKGRLQLREAVLSPSSIAIGQLKEQLTVDQFRVYYNDGFEDTVEIGKLIIHPDKQALPLESNFTRGSSDGTGGDGYIARRDIEITAVTNSYADLLGSGFELMLNNGSVKASDFSAFPIQLRKGDSFSMSYRFLLSKGDIRQFDVFQLMVVAEERNGNPAGVMFINKQPDLYEKDLSKYVRLRKEEALL
ncbi:hypothetical protein [Paenibacillus sp. CF384]|uniref:hypothetical protein n=1 Tax=Paenibacillus sp. CF384 TaxID=1884382 RepID=UPI000898AD99|nr:hypothetical protein [Paenibacillus sp. CF384]SDX05225.1 hypothetical protein SAMN05518855_100868 [Paenibacillus sp. CF384]